MCRKVSFLILFFFCCSLIGQDLNFRIGASFDFGNKVKRIGLRLSSGYGYLFAQFNSTANLYYNFSSLALCQNGFEVQLAIGTQIGFGNKLSNDNKYLSVTDNNMPSSYTIGYAYTRYWDTQGTKQSTGTIVCNLANFAIVTENDLFGAGKGWRDRYRTGAIKFTYRYLDTKFGFSMLFWTGDYASCSKIIDSKYPARFGYRSNDKAIFGNYSLGLFSAQVEYILPYQHVLRLDAGIDSEHIRHFVQNKGLHDMPFYTDKMVKRQLMHIPMLQENGDQFLFKVDETVKSTQIYYNVGLNNNTFY